MNFKQFLEEGRDAPLYHGTQFKNVFSILKQDMIKGSPIAIKHPVFKHSKKLVKGVSLTRNIRFAMKNFSVVLEFDQRKLAQRHKLKPFSYFLNDLVDKTREKEGDNGIGREGWNEYEEVVLGDIKNMSRYLKHIHINEWTVKDMPDSYKSILDHSKINIHDKVIF